LVDPKDFDTMSSELENRLDDLFGENDIQIPDAQEKNLKEHYPLAELKNLILSIDWEITDEVLDNLLLQLKDLQLTYKHDKIVMTFLQILNSLGNYIKTHQAKAHPKTFKILNSVFASLDKVVLSKDMAAPAKKKILRAEMNRYKELRTQIANSKTAAVKRKAIPKAVITEAPVTKEKIEEPVLTLDEPSKPSVTKEKIEEPVLTLDEPSKPSVTKEKIEEPVLTLDEPSEPPPEAAKEELPVTHKEPERDVAMATLAEAVEEIKRYIHTEIKALKEEIQSLR
jgi:hypothetical protein